MIQNLDKGQHFVGGAAIVFAVGLINVPLALLVCILVALAKEVYDYFNPTTNTCDALDFIATVVGGVTAAVLIGV